jgi:hypothetical protein
MLPRPALYFMMSQSPRSMVRAWLNDAPFYRSYAAEGVNRTGPAEHLMVPGENTFAIEIDRAPLNGEVSFELAVDYNHQAPVLYFEWPREASHLPRDQRLPFRWETRFVPPPIDFVPSFLAAPPSPVPCEGTLELLDALRRMHAAVEARDVEGFCREMTFKAAEMERAYPGWPGGSAHEMRKGVAGFFQMDLAVRPLELDDVHFESRAGGRLAHARRTSGGFVIEAISKDVTADGERGRMVIDPTFTREGSHFRLIY